MLSDGEAEITGRDNAKFEPDHWPFGYLPSPNIMKLPHMPAAVVFDMDGLLFDTETLYQEAVLILRWRGATM